MVARESRVGCDEQVAQVDAVADLARTGVDGVDEALHLADGVADQHGQEVVAGLEAVDDAGGDGVDVFEDGGVLYAVHVAGGDGVGVLALDAAGEVGGAVDVLAADGEIAGAREGHFLGVAGAAYYQRFIG